MTSGADLLALARSRPSDAGTPSLADLDPGMVRAALVGALLPGATAADVPLIRRLTEEEIAAVAAADAGCGDVLLACCWLLFRLGQVEDSALVWRAKNLNFDAHCLIDSVFLLPQGVAATVEFARAAGLEDLLEWVAGDWRCDPDEEAQRWRTSSFFDEVPPAHTPVAELAAWFPS